MVVAPSDGELSALWDEAMVLWEAGDRAGAGERLRLLLAMAPGSDVGWWAELHLVRLALDGAPPAPPALDRALEALAASAPDAAGRALAGLYRAWIAALEPGPRTDVDRRLQQVASQRGGPPWFPLADAPHPDLPRLMALWADWLALERNEPGMALRTLDRLLEVAGDDERWIAHAWDRAILLAETVLPPEELGPFWESGVPFLQAVVAGPLLMAEASHGDWERVDAVLPLALQRWRQAGLEARAQATRRGLEALRGGSGGVGLLVSLTGPDRRAGRAVLAGALHAVGAFDAGAGVSVTLFIEDVGQGPEQVVGAMERLQARGVAAVVGPLEDDLAEVARQEGRRLGVPVVALSPTPWPRAQGASWRLGLDPEAEAEALAAHATGLGARRWAVVVEERQGAGEGHLSRLHRALEAAAAAEGAAVVSTLIWASDGDPQAQARALTRDLDAAGADAFVFLLAGPSLAVLSAHLAARDLWPALEGPTDRRRLWLTHAMAVDATVLQESSRYVEGLRVPMAWPEPLEASFARPFEASFGRMATPVEYLAWRAVRAAAAAMAGGAPGPATVEGAWRADQGWTDAAGRVRADPAGNLRQTWPVGRLRQGRIELPAP
jgi:ABC-type branched-subunit amino acid transport system substrate-binding protein